MKHILRISGVFALLLMVTFGTAGTVSAQESADNATPVVTGEGGDFSAAATAPKTINVTTSDGGAIPTGKVISIMGGTSLPGGPAYSDTLTADQTSPWR
ncbi:MAG: hypothetical protein ACR2OE_18825 [Thermomicrobiales bacterium]